MVWRRVRKERDRGGEPFSLAALAEAIIKANGGGKFEIREFPPERKRMDVGDFLIVPQTDPQAGYLAGAPRLRLPDDRAGYPRPSVLVNEEHAAADQHDAS